MADELRGAEKFAFEHFLKMYHHQYDLNSYARERYDDDIEYYLGYRDQDRYPLAYNNSYNILLARIYNVLSRMMEHLYQGGPNDLVGVRARKKSDVSRAPRVKGLLQFQLETLNNIDKTGGSYLFNFNWLFNALTFGKGIAKVYWRKEERITPQRVTVPMPVFQNGMVVGIQPQSITTEAPQIVYDAPYAEVIHNKMFVPHPHYRDIQLMPSVHVVYKRSLDYVRAMAEKGVYKLENLRKLGWSSGKSDGDSAVSLEDSDEAIAKSIGIEGALTYAEMESDRFAPMIDVIESYGRFIFPEDETPYEVGSGVKIKGKESEAIAHIGNYKTLLSLQKNKYGYRPFFDIGAYYHPELYWDYGVIKLGKEMQETYNVLANTRLQNALMSVNQMLKVRDDADINPEALVWKPFGIVPVEEMTDVEPLIVPDQSQTGVFREQEQFLESVISDITGVYPYNMGQTPSRQEHVGCFYEELQILTDRGWLTYDELSHEERVMTLNHDTGYMEWGKPTVYFDTEVGDDFPAYEYKNGNISFTVTEGHRFAVVGRERNGAVKKIKKIEELTDGTDYALPLTAQWKGAEQETNGHVVLGDKTISLEDWCSFLGLYISEGWSCCGRHNGRNRYRVVIRQVDKEKKSSVAEILSRLPYNVHECAGGFEINDINLAKELKPLGKTADKYIPKYIKELPPKYLACLVDALILGDGTTTPPRKGRQEYREFYTTSKRLANDFQEVLLKMGLTGRLNIKKNSKTAFKADTVCYKVSVRRGGRAQFAGKVKKIKRGGRVWCLEVPNGIFMVRSANGLPFWTGNTIYSLQSMGEARTKLLLMTMDYQGFQPFLRYMMMLNTWHLPDNFEARINTPQGESFTPLLAGDIHPEYDFTVRYTGMEPALGKQFRAQQLLQLANIWAQDPTLQHYEWKKAILQLMDLHDTEKYLKSPEQMAQEQEQHAMRAAQVELAGAALQDEMSSRQSNREMQRDVVKGLLK